MKHLLCVMLLLLTAACSDGSESFDADAKVCRGNNPKCQPPPPPPPPPPVIYEFTIDYDEPAVPEGTLSYTTIYMDHLGMTQTLHVPATGPFGGGHITEHMPMVLETTPTQFDIAATATNNTGGESVRSEGYTIFK